MPQQKLVLIIIRKKNSSRRRWVENTARPGELRDSYEIFVGNYEVRTSLSKSNRNGVKFKVPGNRMVYYGLPMKEKVGICDNGNEFSEYVREE
jgi:hypothetical protein